MSRCSVSSLLLSPLFFVLVAGGVCGGGACDVSGGPCPLEVEASDSAVCVEDLAAEGEARRGARFHRFDRDLGEWNASRGGLCVGEASRAGDGEAVLADGVEQGAALGFGEGGTGGVEADAGERAERVGEAGGESVGEPERGFAAREVLEFAVE